MLKLELSDPFPKREDTDLLGIEWRTKIYMRYGIDPRAAFRQALRDTGIETIKGEAACPSTLIS